MSLSVGLVSVELPVMWDLSLDFGYAYIYCSDLYVFHALLFPLTVVGWHFGVVTMMDIN